MYKVIAVLQFFLVSAKVIVLVHFFTLTHSMRQSNFDLSRSAYSNALKILLIKVETSYLDQMFPKLCIK